MIAGGVVWGAPQVLLDVREGGGMRGFHLFAAASELARRQTGARYWALCGKNPDVGIGLNMLRDELGQLVPRVEIDTARLRFDVHLVMADIMPTDRSYLAARRLARWTLVGLMFPGHPRPPEKRLLVADGHDTVGFAALAEARIRKAGSLSSKLRRIVPR